MTTNSSTFLRVNSSPLGKSEHTVKPIGDVITRSLLKASHLRKVFVMPYEFKGLDVRPTSVPNQTVYVEVNPSDLLNDYSINFVNEGVRKHPRLAETVDLTADEVFKYAVYLLSKRIDHVNGNRRTFRLDSLLYVPGWIEYTISNIGKLVIRELGLTFVPVLNESTEVIDDESALDISKKIAMFQDTLHVTRNAFPTTEEGDQDLMTTAVIANYVRATKELSHPVTTYLTAFLGLKLREENAFSLLYRVQYDDINYLRQALDSESGTIC